MGAIQIVGMGDLGKRALAQFCGAVAKHLLQFTVAVQDVLIPIQQGNAQGRAVQNGAQPALLLLEGRLGADVFGDVMGVDEDAP